MIETHWHWHSAYQNNLDWQKQRRKQIIEGASPETLLFTEHTPCITFGKRGGELRSQTSTPVFQINRGGLATWHGFGQLVLYPLINLQRRRIGTRYFVQILEEALLETILDYGVKAVRRDKCPGLWWQDKKLASIGLEIKQGVSMHGCAININNSLEGFNKIVPCGFSNIEMISLSKILNITIPLHSFGKQWQKNLLPFF
jgi:lipoyl(octanoyl) transferase